MNTETKRYNVIIRDQEYNIISDELEEHVKKAAVLVDELMRSLDPDSTFIDQHKLAVLSALQMASQLLQAEEQLALCKEREDALVTWTKDQVAAL